MLVFMLFSILALLPRNSSSLEIYINPLEGKDTLECLNSNRPCANLTWALQQSRQNFTEYILSQGTHTLTENVPHFKDFKNLTFTGNDSHVMCKNTGLAFINVENIAFNDIAFSGCVALHNSTSKNTSRASGLYFELCKNITMSRVSVSDSPNATGVIIYNTDGTNTLKATLLTME